MPVKYLKHIIVIVLFVISQHVFVSAQQINYRIDKVSIDDGLSNNSVHSIIQDHQGFMWFGTESGLNRYDGNNFKAYYNKANDINSLSANSVKNILKELNGSLWIITSSGQINSFNLEFNDITRHTFVDKSSSLITSEKTAQIDKDNRLWFSYQNEGLYSVNLNTNELKTYNHNKSDKNTLSSNNIRSLFIDKDDNIWLGTEEGIVNKFDKKTQKFIHYSFKGINDSGDNHPIIWKIFEDYTGLLWINAGNALYTFNRKTGNRKLILKSENKNDVNSGFVSSIIEDKAKNIWIGTDKGLYRYSTDTGILINLHELANYKSVLTDKNILSLYQDKLGIIWVGSLNEGLYEIHPTLAAFKTICHQTSNPYSISPGPIRSIYYDPKGYLWVGTATNGIIILKNNKRISQPYNFSNHSINQITCDSKGNYWISTGNNGVYLLKNFDPGQNKKAKLLSFRHKPYDLNSLSDNKVTIVYEDLEKNIWLGTDSGLDLFDPIKNQFTHPKLNLKNGNEPVSIQSNCILEDKTGAMWIGTWNGLYRFKYTSESGEIRISDAQYFIPTQNSTTSLNDKQITAICKDSNNELWIGTYSGGLNRLNVKYDSLQNQNSYKFNNYTMSDGLPSNGILGIQSDDKNNLWISTNNGISNFSIKNHHFKNYNIHDGLQSDIFFWGASHKNAKGEIFFGGTNGLNYFFPDSIKKERIAPAIVFNGFKINGQEIKPGKNAALKKQINFAKEITLDYSFDNFSIDFTSLHYGSAGKHEYKFKLEGYNKEWVQTDTNKKTASYPNLKPGNYIFKVKAINQDGLKNEISTEIKITVRNPFWESWWFYTLEVISVLLIILGLIKIREKKLKDNNKKLEQIVSKRTHKIEQQRDEILSQNEEITQHNETLNKYKNHLENQVEKRTLDLVQAKERAEHADMLKTAFIENLSHEIRTPLNAIVGFSNLLGLSENLSDKDLEFISRINFGSESLLKIVDSIMQVSKIQLGEYKISLSEFNISNLMQQVFSIFKLSEEFSKKKNLELLLNLNNLPNEKLIYSDMDSIRIILLNLIENAIKYTESGHIEIGCKILHKNTNSAATNNSVSLATQPKKKITIEPSELQFYVKDTGIGIDQGDLKYVFDKFRKIDNDNTKLYRGLGLGLTIAKSMVEQLNGEIWLESETSKGSTFYFTVST